jgi:hypothetical protein
LYGIANFGEDAHINFSITEGTMELWDMIVAVTVTAVIGGIYFEKQKSKERIELARLNSGADNGRLKQLEERVEVLERLATDKRSRLKEEIDAL